MVHTFSIPTQGNQKLERLVSMIIKDTKLNTEWKCTNVMAIDRMGYNDHGPIHAKIVANLALKILRILVERGVVPSVVRDYKMKNEDAEFIVVLGSIFHDLGMTVMRENHELFSALMAKEFCEKYLTGIYGLEEATILCSEVLHAVVAHEEPHRPLTVEAGIVRIADALDMEKGRARVPFQIGRPDIHSVSALSIEKVTILTGVETPIIVKITMSNSAGIFQIDDLLKPRIHNSGLKDYFHVVAEITGEKETRILDKFEF